MSNEKETTVFVCMAKQCRLNFSEDIFRKCKDLVKKQKIKSCDPTLCLGSCEMGPNILTVNKETGIKKHTNVNTSDLDNLFNKA